jgi:diguanylate cyclase (GGDEF)-like protein
VREILTASGFLIVASAATWINWQTSSDIAAYDCFTFVQVLITRNITLPMRFKTAAIASALSSVIIAAGIVGHPFILAQGQRMSLLMIDIDHFKPCNDAFGHPAGDTCLQTVAHLIKEQVRGDKDVVARMGGEEFAVLLLDAGMHEAAYVAERVRMAVPSATIAHDGQQGWQSVTVSIGAALAPIDDAAAVGSLMLRADEALYDAKHSGRNCVRGDGAESAAP